MEPNFTPTKYKVGAVLEVGFSMFLTFMTFVWLRLTIAIKNQHDDDGG